MSWFGNRFAERCSKTCSNQQGGNIEKMRATTLARYGAANAMTLDSVKEKSRATRLDRYGGYVTDKHVSRREETWARLNTKGRATLMERYGVSNPSQMVDHQGKVVATLQRRYGVSHPQRIPARVVRLTANRIARIEGLLTKGSRLNAVTHPRKGHGRANYRYDITCVCGNTESIPSETVKFRIRRTGTSCCVCSGLTTARSLKEIDVCNFIRSIYQGEVKENDRTIIGPYELDVVLPEKRLAIEFTGLFWYNEDLVGRTYHLRKKTFCEDVGYRLITIFEDEWDNRMDAVKARLTHIIGVTQPTARLHARKGVVGEIDAEQARAFCEHHHIQGYAPATIKLGLFVEQTMVAMMTFSRPSLSKGARRPIKTEWELSRFCLGRPVRGAANKLFQHFLRHYAPSKVITYSDLRWNTGGVYTTMGFTPTHISRPNYWYFKGTQRFHRFGLRKNQTDDPALTEWENRSRQGWKRIWDCGNAVYLWESAQ